MSYFGNYYLTGPDAQAAADWIFTNNMRKPTGETSYTCMLNAQAGVESDLTVSFIEGSATAPWEPSFEVLFRRCTIGSTILVSIKTYLIFSIGKRILHRSRWRIGISVLYAHSTNHRRREI